MHQFRSVQVCFGLGINTISFLSFLKSLHSFLGFQRISPDYSSRVGAILGPLYSDGQKKMQKKMRKKDEKKDAIKTQ